MKCLHCQGEMKKGAAPFHADRRGLHLQLDAVPAWVCAQCGEAYFEAQQVDAIQAALKAVEAHTAQLVATA
jgi:YgiT-type zinc finger domain-containing protein